jgi:hypothetical protein
MVQNISSSDASPRLWCLVSRTDAPQYVDCIGTDAGAAGGDLLAAKAAASRRSLQFDLLYTQYGERLVSQRATAALVSAGLTGFSADRRVPVHAGRGMAPQSYFSLQPRAFAGLAHPSSGVRVTRVYKDGTICFAAPSDPRWRSEPGLYSPAGDMVLIWPFVQHVFVSARFREVVLEHQLTGFWFMPFEAKEPKKGSGWVSCTYRPVTSGVPPSWVLVWQRQALWRQMLVSAEPGVLPEAPPPDWLAPEGGEGRVPVRSMRTPAQDDAQLAWVRRRLFRNLPTDIKRAALDYLRDEAASASSADWTLRSLVWDGDAQSGKTLFRRWRLVDYPEPLWAACELKGGRYSWLMISGDAGSS